MTSYRLAALVFALFVVMPLSAKAQTSPPGTATPAASSDQQLKPEELDALVAPIALYPDTLLSLALMASTYPLEVVQADRWVRENRKSEGRQIKGSGGQAALGREREVFGGHARPSLDDEYKARLDPEAR